MNRIKMRNVHFCSTQAAAVTHHAVRRLNLTVKKLNVHIFKENDKEIYLEMFGNDPILLGKKMAEITLDKIKE